MHTQGKILVHLVRSPFNTNQRQEQLKVCGKYISVFAFFLNATCITKSGCTTNIEQITGFFNEGNVWFEFSFLKLHVYRPFDNRLGLATSGGSCNEKNYSKIIE